MKCLLQHYSTSISVGQSKHDISYFFGETSLASVVKVPATWQLLCTLLIYTMYFKQRRSYSPFPFCLIQITFQWVTQIQNHYHTREGRWAAIWPDLIGYDFCSLNCLCQKCPWHKHLDNDIVLYDTISAKWSLVCLVSRSWKVWAQAATLSRVLFSSPSFCTSSALILSTS